MNINGDSQYQSLASSLKRQLEVDFPEHKVKTENGVITYRRCGQGPVVVLLHGIGSGAASWVECALNLSSNFHVIAWNSPGYGGSTPLGEAIPTAQSYAERLIELLGILKLTNYCLVGHSLGALIASAAWGRKNSSAKKLCLLNPAQGYGNSDAKLKSDDVFNERISTFEKIGIAGLAEKNPMRLLSRSASEKAHQLVHYATSQLTEEGYRQAVAMLCNDAIGNYLDGKKIGINTCVVACGDQDIVTTPNSCAELAAMHGFPYIVIPYSGHASYVENPGQVASLIRALNVRVNR